MMKSLFTSIPSHRDHTVVSLTVGSDPSPGQSVPSADLYGRNADGIDAQVTFGTPKRKTPVRTEVFRERDTGFEPATFSLGS